MLNPFRYFNSSPEVVRLTVLLYVRYPLSVRPKSPLTKLTRPPSKASPTKVVSVLSVLSEGQKPNEAAET